MIKIKLTMLANIMQIVQIAAHIVPQPIPTTVQHYAILLSVVVVRLVLAPCRLQNDVTLTQTQQITLIIFTMALHFKVYISKKCKIPQLKYHLYTFSLSPKQLHTIKNTN